MKFIYLLLLLLPAFEARQQHRYMRQAGRYGTSGGYRPNQTYSSINSNSNGNSNGVSSGSNGIGNNGNSYANVNGNSNNGNVRVAYAPANSAAIVGRPYNGVGAFKYGGRPSPGNEFVVNAVGGGGGGPGGPGGSIGVGSSGGYSLNYPKTVYKTVSGSGVGRPQPNGAYRLGSAPLSSAGRPLAAGGGSGSYHSG